MVIHFLLSILLVITVRDFIFSQPLALNSIDYNALMCR